MTKTYLNEMENYDLTIELTGETEILEDEKGFYTTDKETAKWWQDLYKSLEALKNDKEFLENFTEWQDVIDRATEKGLI